MKMEVYREESNIIVGNQVQEERETIVYFNDDSFEVLRPEETTWTEEEEEIY
ncbi:hypothetical protein M3215_13285 [Bacillus cytotoxicus]|uniref:Uncharacterized protein n=1 Tax=Bacillus cytotoxicus TaxID=580165 RepID=A0ACC6A784_9BACI|nr:hypothetical protein [Bacillus cytotoxicus]